MVRYSPGGKPYCLIVTGVAALSFSCASAPDIPGSPAPETAEKPPGETTTAPLLTTPDDVSEVPQAPAIEPQEEAASQGETLFICGTADGKLIERYDMGALVKYVFGPQGQPELVLEVSREETSTYQWQGIGRYENYSVSVPNGETVYSVFWARDRLDIEQPPEAGVSVEIDGEYITTVDCTTAATHNLIGVDLPPTEF